MKHLKKFETESAYNSYIGGSDAILPNVSLVTENQGMHYNPFVDYSKEPLTFEITSDGVIKWMASNSGLTRTIEYKLNDGDWTSITSTTGGTDINVVNGDMVQFRGDNAAYATGTSAYNTFSGTTASFNVKGNIMSLIDSDDFVNVTALTSSYTFVNLFNNCSGLTDTSKLILPATTLANYCYYSMFSGCTSLTTAPELPATTLASSCYTSMFQDCTSLTTAPELPATTLETFCYWGMFYGCTALTTAPELQATTLAQQCYNNMFRGCTSLTTAPELPATTLEPQSYQSMFSGCTSLNYIKCLATNISASRCTTNWVYGVASSGTFVKAANMYSWPMEYYNFNGIPNGWTVQDAQ